MRFCRTHQNSITEKPRPNGKGDSGDQIVARGAVMALHARRQGQTHIPNIFGDGVRHYTRARSMVLATYRVARERRSSCTHNVYFVVL